ncbi:NAD-dependent epimerase/dehydratase family protein [Microbacterium sp. 10M-3C3]|jgi:nucleoside-diphosphate-sugar epimerase|uniref:NAD-dependent epimerase/dehydratase family protein n=1 Tax=Microbacterium sp. 10M-3C3 TaxID=2483401 RepID=UPI000F632331|nr:NAD-dependent epimerase/dehydratase family protein [Microbacterium sp. 10M-3C3]
MRIFVTGASGWIGSHVVAELLAHGHQVIGLARSDASAERLRAAGAAVVRGDLDEPASLQHGADAADAVVHLANKHDFAHPEVSNAAERAATQAFGDALAGTGKPFLLASGLAIPTATPPLTEGTPSPAHGPDSMRGGSENLALDFVDRGVRTIVARFAPTVHGRHDHGFVAALVAAARASGEVLVAGDGSARWTAVHVDDAAAAVRLGLERAEAGTILHVTAESVRTGDIAAAIGAGLRLPVTATTPDVLAERLGFIGRVFASDTSASSVRTRELMGWTPTGPTLLEDIAAGAYFPVGS